METMTVTVVVCGAEALVRPVGDLDICTSPELERALGEAGRTCAQVLLDLCDLTFVDAAGLRTVCAAKDHLGDRLLLRSPSRQVEHVLAISGLQHLLEPGAAATGVG